MDNTADSDDLVIDKANKKAKAEKNKKKDENVKKEAKPRKEEKIKKEEMIEKVKKEKKNAGKLDKGKKIKAWYDLDIFFTF